jgi:hypothetical protein
MKISTYAFQEQPGARVLNPTFNKPKSFGSNSSIKNISTYSLQEQPGTKEVNPTFRSVFVRIIFLCLSILIHGTCSAQLLMNNNLMLDSSAINGPHLPRNQFFELSPKSFFIKTDDQLLLTIGIAAAAAGTFSLFRKKFQNTPVTINSGGNAASGGTEPLVRRSVIDPTFMQVSRPGQILVPSMKGLRGLNQNHSN